VSARAQEIGVRIALGAGARDILKLVLREGLVLATAGVTLGVALAYAVGRSLEALLAGEPARPDGLLGRGGRIAADGGVGQPLARPPCRARGSADGHPGGVGRFAAK
jgi:ABC-type antimicrobial peptide transport system permease subunit